MTLVVLPHQGVPWLHDADGPTPRPRCPVPSTVDARFCFSSDEAWLGVLDQGGKRAHLYRVNRDALEPVVAPRGLAEGDRGDAIAAYEGVLYVGGTGKSGEMLWRIKERSRKFVPVHVPAEARRWGKSVDAVFVHDGRLLAIDDIVLPKWGFIYDLAEPSRPKLTDVVDLPPHTTYERVLAAALSPDSIVVLSAGINHGTSSAHISRLDLQTLRENESQRWSNDREAREKGDLSDKPLHARAIAVVGGRTVFAGDGPILWEAVTTGPLVAVWSDREERGEPPRYTRRKGEVVPLVTTRFSHIHDIVSAGGSGLYVVGIDPHVGFGWAFLDVGSLPGHEPR